MQIHCKTKECIHFIFDTKENQPVFLGSLLPKLCESCCTLSNCLLAYPFSTRVSTPGSEPMLDLGLILCFSTKQTGSNLVPNRFFNLKLSRPLSWMRKGPELRTNNAVGRTDRDTDQKHKEQKLCTATFKTIRRLQHIYGHLIVFYTDTMTSV